jgi:hypothetical protein
LLRPPFYVAQPTFFFCFRIFLLCFLSLTSDGRLPARYAVLGDVVYLKRLASKVITSQLVVFSFHSQIKDFFMVPVIAVSSKLVVLHRHGGPTKIKNPRILLLIVPSYDVFLHVPI